MSIDSPPRPSRIVTSNADLVAVVGYVLAAALALGAPVDLPTAVALPIALPLFLFGPGYAVVTAIVPTTVEPAARDPEGSGTGIGTLRGGVTTMERLTLAVVASLAVVPMVALVLNFAVGVALVPTLAGVVAVTTGAAVVGAVRRQQPSSPLETGRDRGTSPLRRVPTDAITVGGVAIALVLLASSASLAVIGGDASGTEFYLVTETADGEYRASGYSQTLTRGEAANVTLGVEQHGATTRRYTVVAQLVAHTGTGENATVRARHELDRFPVTVEPDRAAVGTYTIRPTVAGTDLTLRFLCYEGDAPADPSPETAHRVVSLPVDVTRG